MPRSTLFRFPLRILLFLRRNNYCTSSVYQICKVLATSGQTLVELIRCSMELNQPHSGGFLKENPSDASDVAHSLDELHRVGPFPQIPEWNDMYEKIVTLVVGHRRIHIEKAVSGIRADVNGDSMLVDGKLSGPTLQSLGVMLSSFLDDICAAKPRDRQLCFHTQYRSIDGSCNNLKYPKWGAALSPLYRLLPPVYENGVNQPVGWNPEKHFSGYPKPSARLVSYRLLADATKLQVHTRNFAALALTARNDDKNSSLVNSNIQSAKVMGKKQRSIRLWLWKIVHGILLTDAVFFFEEDLCDPDQWYPSLPTCDHYTG
ncbi:Peroxidasin [Echinococcus granulosus]|nr:Peroxidasin [Echinococcus granulosus]